MKERGIAFLTGLWRLLAAIWIFLIIGGAVGVVGNIIFTYVTTGTINFTDSSNSQHHIIANCTSLARYNLRLASSGTHSQCILGLPSRET